MSDSAGRVAFQTVYPGWYRGRTTHIHIKVHVTGQTVHTGQLYMDDATNNAVYAEPPYATRPNRDTFNATDRIFQNGGQESLLSLQQVNGGFVGSLSLGVRS